MDENQGTDIKRATFLWISSQFRSSLNTSRVVCSTRNSVWKSEDRNVVDDHKGRGLVIGNLLCKSEFLACDNKKLRQWSSFWDQTLFEPRGDRGQLPELTKKLADVSDFLKNQLLIEGRLNVCAPYNFIAIIFAPGIQRPPKILLISPTFLQFWLPVSSRWTLVTCKW